MGQLLPLAFCILTRKTSIMYREMFSSIREQAEKRDILVSVSQFKVDFEDPCIKAFQDVYPEANVECCFFHLAQAHWRKIGGLGLRMRYVEDENFAISLRIFTALAFVPQDAVFAVFAELCEAIPEAAHEFIPYMKDTYIGAYRYKSRTKPDGSMVFKRQWREPLFEPSLWNVRARSLANEPRTNNHLEGWHRRFKTIVDKHHPNIFEFVGKLRGEQARTETTVEQLVAGANPVQVRQKLKKVNKKLLKIVTEYENRTAMDFLRGIAYNVRY